MTTCPICQTNEKPAGALICDECKRASLPVKRFRFHWRDGIAHVGSGTDPAAALTQLGFGQGALAALDYWEELPPFDSTLSDYDLPDDAFTTEPEVSAQERLEGVKPR